MASNAIRMRFEVLRELAFGSITASYVGVGTALANPAVQILVQNFTDVHLYFSINGVDNHFRLPPNGFFLSDISSNKTTLVGLFMAQGDRLYVKAQSGLPTTGDVSFSVVYPSES